MDEFSKFQRLLWGVAGGGVAVAVKFMGQDIYWLRVLNDTRAADQLRGMIVFYIVLTLILCFVGAVAAMASKENSENEIARNGDIISSSRYDLYGRRKSRHW